MNVSNDKNIFSKLEKRVDLDTFDIPTVVAAELAVAVAVVADVVAVIVVES